MSRPSHLAHRRRLAFMLPAICVATTGLARAQECIWTPGPASTTPNTGGGAVFHDVLGRVVCMDHQFGPLRAWAWSGTAWDPLSSAGAPTRSNFAMAYDIARNRVVLFGGVQYNPSAQPQDTWEWDGVQWMRISEIGPPPRVNHAMAYDAARGRIVLFGGAAPNLTTNFDDTWEWDGAVWVQLPSGGPGPSARAGHAIAYDAGRARIVLFGGSQSNTTLGDLWERAGTTWIERSSSGPSPRAYHAFFYDASRGTLVMAGGNSASGTPIPPFETWEYNGATGLWALRSAGNYFGVTRIAAFDIPRSRGVLVSYIGPWEWNGAGSITGAYVTQHPVGGTFNPGSVASFSVAAVGTALSYQWRKGGQPLVNGGNISGATSSTLVIDPVTPADVGYYSARVFNSCALTGSNEAPLSLPGGPCYANCDESTVPPILNVADFICFLNRFAAGDPYANCTTGTIPPVLSPDDFTCFLNRYGAGCP